MRFLGQMSKNDLVLTNFHVFIKTTVYTSNVLAKIFITFHEILWSSIFSYLSRKENIQKLTQLSPTSHPRHLVGKMTAQKDAIKDITSDSQVNSYFP